MRNEFHVISVLYDWSLFKYDLYDVEYGISIVVLKCCVIVWCTILPGMWTVKISIIGWPGQSWFMDHSQCPLIL